MMAILSQEGCHAGFCGSCMLLGGLACIRQQCTHTPLSATASIQDACVASKNSWHCRVFYTLTRFRLCKMRWAGLWEFDLGGVGGGAWVLKDRGMRKGSVGWLGACGHHQACRFLTAHVM